MIPSSRSCNVLVTSQGNGVIKYAIADGTGSVPIPLGGTPGMGSPSGLAVMENGDILLSEGAANGRVLKYDSAGAFLSTFIAGGTGGLATPGNMLLLIPEPGTLALVTLGGLMILRRRRNVRAGQLVL